MKGSKNFSTQHDKPAKAPKPYKKGGAVQSGNVAAPPKYGKVGKKS